MSIELTPGEDLRQILDAAGAMLAAAYPLSRLHAGEPDDLSDITAFGTFEMALPNTSGADGFSLVEEAQVHRLFGQSLVSTRALATALAIRLEPDLACGPATACAAIPQGDGLLLIDGGAADFALVFDAAALRLVSLDSAARAPASGLGHAFPVARTGGLDVITARDDAEVQIVAAVLIGAQLLGAAEACRDLAVDHAKVREQFGRPIGAFQAIKHQAADMAIGAELVSAQLDMAAIAGRDRRDDALFQAAALRRLAARVALDNARRCVQIHGGIGFSAEAPAHHFVKRVHLLNRLGSTPDLLDLPAPLPPTARMETPA